jgi:hypothetical protein
MLTDLPAGKDVAVYVNGIAPEFLDAILGVAATARCHSDKSGEKR